MESPPPSTTMQQQQQHHQPTEAAIMDTTTVHRLVKRERDTNTQNNHASPHQAHRCQLDHRFRLLPQPGVSRINKESLTQTVWEALDLAYDLLEEEDDYYRDLSQTLCVQGRPASEFATHSSAVAASAKRKRY
jgi:hypothetical protein